METLEIRLEFDEYGKLVDVNPIDSSVNKIVNPPVPPEGKTSDAGQFVVTKNSPATTYWWINGRWVCIG